MLPYQLSSIYIEISLEFSEFSLTNLNHYITMKNFLCSIALILVSFSCKEQPMSRQDKDLAFYVDNSPVIADAMEKFKQINSIKELSIYMRDTYAFNDFEQITAVF